MPPIANATAIRAIDSRLSFGMGIERALTGFTLGVGRVLKETAGGESVREHRRSTSPDEGTIRRGTPDCGASGNRHNQDGRRSVESQRGWDPTQGNLSRRVSWSRNEE